MSADGREDATDSTCLTDRRGARFAARNIDRIATVAVRMADEGEIVKAERAAAPDGAVWMDHPPEGVQVGDFVCGLRRGGVKYWIDNDGISLDRAVFMMARDLVALITEAIRLGDRQWAPLLSACKDAAVAEADRRAAAVIKSCDAVVDDVREVIGAEPCVTTYDAIRAFADSAKVSSRALAEYANMLGCGEGERIGDHLRRIISAVDGCSGVTLAAKVEELRDALLVASQNENKRHAEIASAARLLSVAGFSGATLEDRVKAVIQERDLTLRDLRTVFERNEKLADEKNKLLDESSNARVLCASIEAENIRLVDEIDELKRVSSARAAKVRDALENNVGSPARAVLLAGIALYEPIGGAS